MKKILLAVVVFLSLNLLAQDYSGFPKFYDGKYYAVEVTFINVTTNETIRHDICEEPTFFIEFMNSRYAMYSNPNYFEQIYGYTHDDELGMNLQVIDPETEEIYSDFMFFKQLPDKQHYLVTLIDRSEEDIIIMMFKCVR